MGVRLPGCESQHSVASYVPLGDTDYLTSPCLSFLPCKVERVTLYLCDYCEIGCSKLSVYKARQLCPGLCRTINGAIDEGLLTVQLEVLPGP